MKCDGKWWGCTTASDKDVQQSREKNRFRAACLGRPDFSMITPFLNLFFQEKFNGTIGTELFVFPERIV